MLKENLEEMINGYIEASLFAGGGAEEEINQLTKEDFTDNALAIIKDDCEMFILKAIEFVPDFNKIVELWGYDLLGHNLFLERNGYGVGFFDREIEGSFLFTSIVKEHFKNNDVYINDNGKIDFETNSVKEKNRLLQIKSIAENKDEFEKLNKTFQHKKINFSSFV